MLEAAEEKVSSVAWMHMWMREEKMVLCIRCV